VQAALARLLDAEPIDLDYRIRLRDGQIRWIRMIAFPMRDVVGTGARLGGIASDVTERKIAEEQQLLLIAELNHRVKNTLATVLSLSRQAIRRDSRDPAVTSGSVHLFLADFQARLLALSQVHDLLSASNWRGAMLGTLVMTTMERFLGKRKASMKDRFACAGPDAWLSPRQALGLAMALHEMASNAVRHGALSTAAGRLDVAWRQEADACIRFEWVESGGPPVPTPSEIGFGTRLLQSGLATELGENASVELDYAAEGFRASIRFRLAAPEGVG
jgi:two-component sensor histidine kinase